MRVMIDTNVFVSAFILSSQPLIQMVDNITTNHTIVLPTYIVDELKRVTSQKFPNKYGLLKTFLCELPHELVYTPDKIDKSKYPAIRDAKDLPILVSAIIEKVGDTDFAPLGMDRPEILTPQSFLEKYR